MFANVIDDKIFWPLIVGIIVLGIIMFICTGFIKIKKGYVAIIEKNGQYVGTYRQGIRYFAPLMYKRAGMYKLGEIKQRVILDEAEYFVTYEIINFKDFHYVANHNIASILDLALKENPDDLTDSLIKRSKLIGVKFIKAEEIINER